MNYEQVTICCYFSLSSIHQCVARNLHTFGYKQFDHAGIRNSQLCGRGGCLKNVFESEYIFQTRPNRNGKFKLLFFHSIEIGRAVRISVRGKARPINVSFPQWNSESKREIHSHMPTFFYLILKKWTKERANNILMSSFPMCFPWAFPQCSEKSMKRERESEKCKHKHKSFL